MFGLELRRSDPDRVLKARLFWGLLVTCVLLSLIAHYVEALESAELRSGGPMAGLRSSPKAPCCGSFGTSLERLEPRPKGKRSVLMLGNSVYQSCEIVERMQRFADSQGLAVEFYNFSKTGAGIYDNFLQFAREAEHHPDLVVISFIGYGFAEEYAGKPLPKFRTDSDQLMLDPSVVRAVPASFYWREITAADAMDAAVTEAFPVKRLDWLIRRKVDGLIFDESSERYEFVRRQFPLPMLNLVREWNSKQPRRAAPAKKPVRYRHAREVLEELFTIAERNDVPLLMLRQETGPRYRRPDVLPLIQEVADEHRAIFVADLEHHFVSREMPDNVHPRGNRARDKYAKRHYDAVMRVVRTLGWSDLDSSSPARRSPSGAPR